jgi:hypothetical protein
METKNNHPWGWNKANVKANAEAMRQSLIAASQNPKK